MEKAKKRRLIYRGVILTLVAVAFVFIMSGMDGQTSNELSTSITRKAGEYLLDMELDGWRLSKVNAVVRKAAHFIMYGGLAMVLFILAYSFSNNTMKSMASALVTSLIIAVIDEINQLGVVGRGGEIADVLIDSAGVLLSVLFVGALTGIINYINAHHK